MNHIAAVVSLHWDNLIARSLDNVLFFINLIATTYPDFFGKAISSVSVIARSLKNFPFLINLIATKQSHL